MRASDKRRTAAAALNSTHTNTQTRTNTVYTAQQVSCIYVKVL